MDLIEFGKEVAKLGLPLLGAALPVPGGAAIGTALASMIGAKTDAPEDVLAVLRASADAVDKARQFEYAHQEAMLKMVLDSQTSLVEAVNRTLQTEAMGGSYWQRNHHAFESSFVCVLVGLIYFGLPAFGVAVPAVPESAWIMLGGILGVTAWQRGTANIITAGGASK